MVIKGRRQKNWPFSFSLLWLTLKEALFPVNFLHNCFVNDFYIYENVCFFFLLSKKLSVVSFLAGHRHAESLSDPSQCTQPPSGWPP